MIYMSISTVIKVCFDTNVFISAFIFFGNPAKVFDLAVEAKIKLVTSTGILTEIANVLDGKFSWREEDIKKQLKVIRKISNIVVPEERIRVIKYDPDNKVLEAGITGGVDYIISGDKKHLLPLKEFRGIQIVSSKQFLDIFQES